MSKFDEITNSQEIIDSRDIEERIEYLESERSDYQEEHNLPDWDEFKNSPVVEDDDLEKWAFWEDSDEGVELTALCALRDDLLEGYCDDWKYGVALIRDDYFQVYAEELVKDIGDLPEDLPWYIQSNIDWKGVADDIRQDYTRGEFDGVTYWAR